MPKMTQIELNEHVLALQDASEAFRVRGQGLQFRKLRKLSQDLPRLWIECDRAEKVAERQRSEANDDREPLQSIPGGISDMDPDNIEEDKETLQGIPGDVSDMQYEVDKSPEEFDEATERARKDPESGKES